MKKEYIELFEGIEPDEKINNKALDKAANNSKIPFSPKKFIAFAAVFALILSVGFGVYRSSSVNVVNDDGTSQQTAQSSLDFSIVAYAKENENGVNVISDDDVTLTNIKITLNEEADGYSISAESSDDGLSVRSDEDIETVIFECENGSLRILTDLSEIILSVKINTIQLLSRLLRISLMSLIQQWKNLAAEELLTSKKNL